MSPSAGEHGEIFICNSLILLLFLSHSMEDRRDNMPLRRVNRKVENSQGFLKREKDI